MRIVNNTKLQIALALLTCAFLVGALGIGAPAASADGDVGERGWHNLDKPLMPLPEEAWNSAPMDYAGGGATVGSPAYGSDANVVPSSIDRTLDPIILTGAALPQFAGASTDSLFVYAYSGGDWQQIPFQVDEVVEIDSQQVFTDTIGSPLDEDDQIVFMASDLGGRPDDEEISATVPISPTWYRIEVSDPLSPSKKGWAYIVRSANLTKTFTETYVSYDGGDERIVADEYELGFLAGQPGLDYQTMEESEEDVVDRTKLRVMAGQLVATEDDIGAPEPDAVKTGPVRVIVQNRGTVGYRSVIYTTLSADLTGYDGARISTDFNENAVGATFYNANTPGGVMIDGDPDTVDATPMSAWWQVSDDTGSLVQFADTSAVGGTKTNYYKDNNAEDSEDTGDLMSYGDTGLAVESPDPMVTYQTALFVLPPDQPNVGAQYADYGDNPLQLTATPLFAASVAVEKTGPEQATVGDTITYEVSITNTSSSDAPDLMLDAVDDSLVGDLQSVAAAQGCDVLAADETCSFTYTYTVNSEEPDPLLNAVEVHYHPQGFGNDVTDSDGHEVDVEPVVEEEYEVYLPVLLRN